MAKRNLLYTPKGVSDYDYSGMSGVNNSDLVLGDSFIRKVVVMKNGGLRVEMEDLFAESDESIPRVVKHTLESNVPVHRDLLNVLCRMIPHFLLLNELDGVKENDKVLLGMMNDGMVEGAKGYHPANDWRIKNVQFHGDGVSEGDGIIMYVQKTVKRSGKPIGVLSPLVQKKEDYAFMGQLLDAYDDLCLEVRLYLGGKHAPGQMQLFSEHMDAEAA